MLLLLGLTLLHLRVAAVFPVVDWMGTVAAESSSPSDGAAS
jgi:hypothetical protein